MQSRDFNALMSEGLHKVHGKDKIFRQSPV